MIYCETLTPAHCFEGDSAPPPHHLISANAETRFIVRGGGGATGKYGTSVYGWKRRTGPKNWNGFGGRWARGGDTAGGGLPWEIAGAAVAHAFNLAIVVRAAGWHAAGDDGTCVGRPETGPVRSAVSDGGPAGPLVPVLVQVRAAGGVQSARARGPQRGHLGRTVPGAATPRVLRVSDRHRRRNHRVATVNVSAANRRRRRRRTERRFPAADARARQRPVPRHGRGRRHRRRRRRLDRPGRRRRHRLVRRRSVRFVDGPPVRVHLVRPPKLFYRLLPGVRPATDRLRRCHRHNGYVNRDDIITTSMIIDSDGHSFVGYYNLYEYAVLYSKKFFFGGVFSFRY